jgi:hypothetical protein
MKLVTYTHGAIARPGLLVTSPDAKDATAKSDDASGAVVLDLVRALGWVDGKRNGAASDERVLAEKFGDSVLGFIEHARDARPLALDAVAAYGRGDMPAELAFDQQDLVAVVTSGDRTRTVLE